MTSPEEMIGWLQWWDGVTGLSCHRLAARSPSHDGLLFALCWRCAGIYLGIAASALWSLGRTRGPARPPTNASAVVCVLLMVPLLVDGWGQTLGLWQTPSNLRFATGWAMGISLPPLCLPLLAAPRSNSRRSIGDGLEWLMLLAGGVIVWGVLRLSSESVGILMRVAVNFGQLFLLAVFAGAVGLPAVRRWLPSRRGSHAR